MAFDWKDFIALARFLQAQAGNGIPEEASYRCAVSRAYFGAYGYALHYACQWLEFHPSVRPEDRSRDHGRLRAHLARKKRQRIAEKLEQLREWRNDCDYEENFGPDFPTLAASALDAADYIFRGLTPPTSDPG